MWLTLAAWLLLCVPGAVLGLRLRWMRPDAGLLGLVGEGYLITLGLCLPVAWLGYALELPIAVLGVWIAGLIAAGLIASVQQASVRWRARGDRAPQPRATTGRRLEQLLAALCGLVILVDLYLSAQAGANVTGDARFHMARVRSLFDEGFNQWDPFVTGQIFTRVYHSNLWHALLAAIALLTDTAPHGTWVDSLPCAKLLLAAGTYGLVHSVTGHRGLAWAAAAAQAIWLGPILFSNYPNRLAPGFPLALGLGYVCQLWQRPARATGIKLALCAAITPAIHPLYGLFLVALAVPSLLARALGRTKNARTHLLCALAVATLASPHLLLSKFHGDSTGPPPPAYPALVGSAPSGPPAQAEPATVASKVVAIGPFQALPLRHWLDPTGNRVLLVLGAVLGLFTRRRAASAGLLSIALGLTAIAYVPPLCAAFIAVTGFDWTVDRLAFTYTLLRAAALSACALYLFERSARWLPKLPTASLVMLASVALVAEAWLQGAGRGHYDRAHYLDKAERGTAQATVAGLNRTRDLLSRHLRLGDTVLAGLDMPGNITPLLPVRFVGVQRSGAPLPDWRRRMRDSWSLLNDRHLDPAVRRQLFAYYGIDRVLIRARGERFVPRRAARFHNRLRHVVRERHLVGPWLILDAATASP